MLCDKLYRLRFFTDRVSPVFVCSYLGSSQVRGQIEVAASGASPSMVNIAQSAILDLPLPIPTVTEQSEIVAFVDAECQALVALSNMAESAIALLQERRSALISAAVTGQIDVRHLATADAA